MAGERVSLPMIAPIMPVATANPCGGCPGNRGCCGGEKASPLVKLAVSETLRITIPDLTPSNAFGSILFKRQGAPEPAIETSDGYRRGVGGGTVNTESTCNDCGEKYNSLQTHSHKKDSKTES